MYLKLRLIRDDYRSQFFLVETSINWPFVQIFVNRFRGPGNHFDNPKNLGAEILFS